MDIDKLTIGEAKQILAQLGPLAGASGAVETGETRNPAPMWTSGFGRAVIVRARDAGVHFGYLVGFDGRRVDLTNARRLWSWKAAKDGSLSGVAVYGVNQTASKIAAKVPTITILDACEIIDASPEAVKTIEAAKWE